MTKKKYGVIKTKNCNINLKGKKDLLKLKSLYLFQIEIY